MHSRPFSPRPGSSGSRPYTRPVQKGKRLTCPPAGARWSLFYRH